MNGTFNILAFCGSLRKGSYNMSLLQAAQKLAPENTKIEIFDISTFPLFNQDLEHNMPAPVLEFKQKIKAADAVLISSPEYNYSIPGVLKNAIDWASRPYGDSAFEDKPVAIMSTSTGMLGGSRAQYHLRQVFVFLNAHLLNKPEVIVPNAAEKFDEQGRLKDLKTCDKISELLTALSAWAERLHTQPQPARQQQKQTEKK